jgi:hypothetical protein
MPFIYAFNSLTPFQKMQAAIFQAQKQAGSDADDGWFRIRTQSQRPCLTWSSPALLRGTLAPVNTAKWNAAGLRINSCLKGTRISLLEAIHNWVHSNTLGSVCWLKGFTGTGKSTVARTVCQDLAGRHILGAAFFVSRFATDRRSSVNVIHTLAYQLAVADETIRRSLCKALREDRNLPTSTLENQISSLIAEPLLNRNSNAPGQLMVIVIDALDECLSEDGQEGG